jgi:hypothetical protein
MYSIVNLFRISQKLEDCPYPHLWGVSLIDTKMCVYCGDKATLRMTPEATRTAPEDSLEDQWDVDILSQEGFRKMKEVIGDIFTHADSEGTSSR